MAVSSALPVCVQYVGAFSTPIVAVMVAFGAGIIAFGQMRIAREKLRLDLSKERYDAYRRFRQVMDNKTKDKFDDIYKDYQVWSHMNGVIFDEKTSALMDAMTFFAWGYNDEFHGLIARKAFLGRREFEDRLMSMHDKFTMDHQSTLKEIQTAFDNMMAPISIPSNTGADIGPLLLFLFGMVAVPAGVAAMVVCAR